MATNVAERFSVVELGPPQPDGFGDQEIQKEITAAEIETVPDHPLQGLVDLGFTEVQIGVTIQADGEVSVCISAKAEIIPWPDLPVINPELRGKGQVVQNYFQIELGGDGQQFVNMILDNVGPTDANETEQPPIVDEAWGVMAEVQGGITLLVRAQQGGAEV